MAAWDTDDLGGQGSDISKDSCDQHRADRDSNFVYLFSNMEHPSAI